MYSKLNQPLRTIHFPRWRMNAILLALSLCVTTVRPMADALGQEPIANGLAKFEFAEPHLGTIVSFTVYAPDSCVANRSAQAAYNEVRRLNAIFSTYQSDSELVTIHKQLRDAANSPSSSQDVSHSRIRLSQDLFHVLDRSIDISRRTSGAFDVTVGPYSRIWKRAIRRSTLPDPTRIAQAAGAVGYGKVRLDSATQSVQFPRTNNFDTMRLDFSAIAKGYIADRAFAVFKKQGLPVALVNAGGDITVGDPPPGKIGWEIAIEHGRGKSNESDALNVKGRSNPKPPSGPQPAPIKICLRNAGIATSGDAFQQLTVAGTRYSHIIDPRTGAAVTHGLAVTVIATDALTADALASAASVVGKTGSPKIFETYPNSAHLYVSESVSNQPRPAAELARFCQQITKHNQQQADK